jgi:hypothetical protein
MKHRRLQIRIVVVLAISVLWGCASVPPDGVVRGASDVKVYESSSLAPTQYEVVRRLWVDSWRAAFWVPTYPTEAEAIASLQAEAGRHGADGLTNVICLEQGHPKWSSNREPAILCYGNAIRVRRSEG